MRKKAILIPLISLAVLVGCESATAPEVKDCPVPMQRKVTRQWFYKKVGEMRFIDKKILVQRADWLAELLGELDIGVEEK